MAEPACAVFPSALVSASAARTWAVSNLPGWVCAEIRDALALLVSEAVTNAVLHAGSDVHARLIDHCPTLRLEVDDNSGVVPIPRVADPDDETGRGMLLIDALADAWGTDTRSGRGKTVWIEITDPHQHVTPGPGPRPESGPAAELGPEPLPADPHPSRE